MPEIKFKHLWSMAPLEKGMFVKELFKKLPPLNQIAEAKLILTMILLSCTPP
ncbi:MAG: hypothetical protein OEW37_03790 [Rhodospirillaceae bacterium]|nr:hypothetical protein [Rhodospirillaceae bacterium]